jgi:protein-S-isoprenylcysteine O-methyltransferase Ste14
MTTVDVVRLVVFPAASAGLAWITRASLLAPGSHGFVRFFAWECILALVLLNAESWIRDPLSPRQIVSWLLLAASVLLVIPGVLLLRRVGMPADTRKNKPIIGIESTTELVSVGLYRYIRHPLYSSLLFLAWGVFAKENVRFFGSAYVAYMKRTRKFIPFLF